MIDHFGINVKSLEKSKVFYNTVLEPLNCVLKKDFGVTVGYGKNHDHGINFWLVESKPGKDASPIHIAFHASSKEEVDKFYETALKNGATCNGPPGLRTQYHPHYYAAFVFDIDGNNIEAVYHGEHHPHH